MPSQVNTEWIDFHLEEAVEEVRQLRNALQRGDHDEIGLGGAISVALGHLNAAWNGRYTTLKPTELDQLPDSEWQALRRLAQGLDPRLS